LRERRRYRVAMHGPAWPRTPGPFAPRSRTLRLEECFDDRRTIHGDERSLPPPPHVVDLAGDEPPCRFRFPQQSIGSRKFVVDLPANRLGPGWKEEGRLMRDLRSDGASRA
jgi:hypothetical protein